jgi:hypothetical protein
MPLIYARTHTHTYRLIKKSLCTWWFQYSKLHVMFKVSPASLQTFIDTPYCVLECRVQYSMVRIPNVFCDYNLQNINCVGIVRIHWVFACFCTVIIRCTETFWSSCIYIYIYFVFIIKVLIILSFSFENVCKPKHPIYCVVSISIARRTTLESQNPVIFYCCIVKKICL